MLDYPNFYAATSAFGSTGGNLSALAATFRETQETYGNGSYSPSVIASFLENHDNARFTNSTIDPVVRVPPSPPRCSPDTDVASRFSFLPLFCFCS